MKRALKALGLSLLVVLALSGLAASAASAEFFIFKSEAEKTTLSGEQTGTSTLSADAGNLKCETATFKGEMLQESAVELAVTPEYKSCTFAGFPAEVAMHSCRYVFRVVNGTTNKTDAVIDCEAGETITVISKSSGVTKCTLDIGEQEGLNEVKFENEGSPKKAKATISLTGIKYDQTTGTGLGACMKAENTTTGTYAGTMVLKGLNGEVQMNLTLEPIPQKVKIDKNPITMGGKVNDKETFEVENVVAEAVTLIAMLRPAHILRPKNNCGKLAKKGDKCQEELVCNALTGVDHKIAVLTTPIGGDMTVVKNC